MIKYLSIFSGLILLLASCTEKKVKQIPLIEGLVSNYNQNYIFLIEDDKPGVALDTVEVNQEGKFVLYKQSISKPGFYHLKFGQKGKVNFFLRPTDYINLRVDANKLLESCKSNNSKFMTVFWQIERNNLAFKNEMAKVTAEFSSLIDSTYCDSTYQGLYRRKADVIEDFRNKSRTIAKKFGSPIIDFLMLNQKSGNVSLFNLKDDIQLFLDNAEALNSDEQLEDLFASYDKMIMEAYALVRAEERYHKGGKFPELKARSNWNEQVSLRKINGEVVHVIFWNGTSMLDKSKIKEIKQLMFKYGPKGLKTLMVAYSNDKETWLSKIKEYRLPYFHLIDTGAIQSTDLTETGVSALPCNFVVDSTGTILNREIWGKELEQSIGSYIKK